MQPTSINQFLWIQQRKMRRIYLRQNHGNRTLWPREVRHILLFILVHFQIVSLFGYNWMGADSPSTSNPENWKWVLILEFQLSFSLDPTVLTIRYGFCRVCFSCNERLCERLFFESLVSQGHVRSTDSKLISNPFSTWMQSEEFCIIWIAVSF